MPKNEVEKLMNELVPFAKRLLAERGEFYPFGGYLKPDGEIVHVGVEQAGTDKPKSTDLFQLLKQSFQIKAQDDECRATAILADVRVVPPNSSHKSDAIQVLLDHQDGYTAAVFYPYTKARDNIVYEAIFAQMGDSDIFQGRLKGTLLDS